MNSKTERWLYGLGSAAIGGGAGAVVSGFTAMGIDPDKFNFTSTSGVAHFFLMAILNFSVSGFLSIMFYLKQSPLPPESTGDTVTITKASVTQISTQPTQNPPTNP